MSSVEGLKDGDPGYEATSATIKDRKSTQHHSLNGVKVETSTNNFSDPRDGNYEEVKNLEVCTASINPTASSNSELPLSKARTIALVVTLTGAAFLNTLSVQASVIVLPTIGEDLSIPSAKQQWIVSSYSLSFGCFLVLWGRLADVYGKRPIFILGSAWLCVTTLVCPFVPDAIGFNVMRGLQGLGAAANVPTAIGILGVTFPPSKAKNYAFATYSSGAPLGSIFGNLLGGVVGQYASWKWIFWILAMIASVVTIAGFTLIPVTIVQPVKKAVDWSGGILLTVALFSLLFALTEGNIVGWRRPYIPAVIVVSVFLLAAFVFWQLYLEKRTERRPLIKMTLFLNVRVAAAMGTMAIFMSSFFNFLILATFWFQDWQGLSAIQTTLRFLPTGPAGSRCCIRA